MAASDVCLMIYLVQCFCNDTVLIFSLAVTKLDILDDFDEVKVGVAYYVDGEKVETFPGKRNGLLGV